MLWHTNLVSLNLTKEIYSYKLLRFFITLINNSAQLKMSKVPPIGVIHPIILKSKFVSSLVARPYIEPEKKITPKSTNQNKVLFNLFVVKF
jgi:hypothetical protein